MSFLRSLFSFSSKKKDTSTVTMPMSEYLELIESLEKQKDINLTLEEELEDAEDAAADVSYRLLEINHENTQLKALLSNASVKDFQALHAYLRQGITYLHAEVKELRSVAASYYVQCDEDNKLEPEVQAAFVLYKDAMTYLRNTRKTLTKMSRMNVIVKALARTPNP